MIMGVDFSLLKKLMIGGVELKQLLIGGIQVLKSGATNLIPTSIDTDGSIFNGVGYKKSHRLNSSGAVTTATAAHVVCGFIPAKYNDTVYFDGLNCRIGDSGYGHCYFWTYDKNFATIKGSAVHQANFKTFFSEYTTDADGHLKSVKLNYSALSNCAYIRLSYQIGTGQSAETATITVNEPIN